jgi:5-methylthioadenosine/S-adenosylhomocysteine deaminase
MAPALELTGIRGILARSTLDLRQNIPPEMHDTPEASIEKGRRLFKEWNGRAGGRIRVWMAMRQIMICSRDLVTQIHQLAAELHTSIHIHLAEEHSEVDWAVAHSGLRPAEYLESIGFLGPNVHAAHSVFLSDRELDLYEQYNVSVAHCPFVAFAFCGPTRVPEMLRRGIRVGLGSDGAPTGNPDLFRQLHLCHLGLMASFGIPYHNPAPILPDDLLRLATIGGAKAISWDEEIGSLEPGKKADLIILSREELDLLCPYDPVYAAAHVVDGADVRTVVVDGRVVVDDGRLVNVNEDELREKIEDRAPQIVSRFLKRMQAT